MFRVFAISTFISALFHIAYTVMMLIVAFSNETPQVLRDKDVIWIGLAGPFLLLLFIGLTYVEKNEAEKLDLIPWPFWVINFLYVPSTLAFAITLAHLYLPIQVFACDSPRMADFSWLVIDSLAKGVLFDLLESFHIDLYRCEPNKKSWVTSSFVFLIRTFSTYVVVWFIVQRWQYWKPFLLWWAPRGTEKS